MSRRRCGRGLALLLAAGIAGCRTPVLWVGAARVDAGDGSAPPQAASPQPAAAAEAGTARDMPPLATQPVGAPPPPAAGSPASTAADGGVKITPGVADELDAGTAPPAPPVPTRLPSVVGECPDLPGPGTYTFRVPGRSLSAQLYMRPRAQRNPSSPGPLIMYFHAVGSSSAEVVTGLGQQAIDQVVAQGGVVASFNAVPCLRCGIDDVVWYDEDDAISDQAVACIRGQVPIDTRHIHSLGFSAGALHSMHLVLSRSDYIASVVSYSGGMPISAPPPQDPDNKVPALLTFGRPGLDNALADFYAASHDWYDTYTPRGYYTLMCNHGGGHEIAKDVVPHALRFLLDHPYKVSPEPYREHLPPGLPDYCQNPR